MGRNKIKIEKIANERNRQVTFYKRKRGLIKKAMEISLLCEVKVMLCIVDKNEKVVLYSSEDLRTFLRNYVRTPMENNNYLRTENGKRNSKKQLAQGVGEENKELNTEILNLSVPTHLKINTPGVVSKKKKSMFFKNTENNNKSEKNIFLIENSDHNRELAFNDILEIKENLKEAPVNRNDEMDNKNLSVSSLPLHSIYSAPSLHDKGLSESVIVKNIKRRGTTFSESSVCENSFIDSITCTIENDKPIVKKEKKPSCFKKNINSRRQSVCNSPRRAVMETAHNSKLYESALSDVEILNEKNKNLEENKIIKDEIKKNQQNKINSNSSFNNNLNQSSNQNLNHNITPTFSQNLIPNVNQNYTFSPNFTQNYATNFNQSYNPTLTQNFGQNLINNYPHIYGLQNFNSAPNYTNNFNTNQIINPAYINLVSQISHQNSVSNNLIQQLINNKRARSNEDYVEDLSSYENYIELLKNRIMNCTSNNTIAFNNNILKGNNTLGNNFNESERK